jgi:hypothetical protein
MQVRYRKGVASAGMPHVRIGAGAAGNGRPYRALANSMKNVVETATVIKNSAALTEPMTYERKEPLGALLLN